jgi:hypothetical protein
MPVSDKLKNDLITGMDIERVFQKHVIDGPSYLFSIDPNCPDDEYELRHDIATATNSSINDVILVGSSKLGFSVKTEKFYKLDANYEKTKKFSDKSDIDIALVNRSYFE